MVWNLIEIGVGIVFLVLMMALVLNPPEAWIKRAFKSKDEEPRPRS